MTRRLISSGSRFEAEIGYSRAVVDGDLVFVSGTTGYDYATMTIAEGVAEQADQAFRNIEAALAQAGASLRDVARALFIIPRREDWEPCWPVVRDDSRLSLLSLSYCSRLIKSHPSSATQTTGAIRRSRPTTRP